MPLSSKEDEIRLKVAITLAKHIDWRTKRLERKAYARIAEELNSFGVSKISALLGSHRCRGARLRVHRRLHDKR